jgi:hypothetical protein
LNASAEPVPVRIVDLSRGGCCVKSPVAVPVGHRLTVFAGDQNGPGDVVRLRIHWQQETGDAWLLGCAFVRDSDYATLAALAPQQAATARAGRWVQSVLGLAPTAPLSAVPSTPG